MKFLVCVFALLLSITAFANKEEAPGYEPTKGDTNTVSTNTVSTNKITTTAPGANTFYIVQPGVVHPEEAYRDMENMAVRAVKKSWKSIVSSAQEGKRLVVRYFDVATPAEIYAKTNVLPDDVLLVKIKSFALPAELQTILTEGGKDHPYTAQLQLNIKRASGKQFFGLKARPVGVASEVFIAEFPPEEENGQPLKFLQGRDPIKLTYGGDETLYATAAQGLRRHYPNATHDLIFEVRGQDIYNALNSLRYNPRKYDTFYFSLAIVANRKNPYIYDLVKIDLNKSQIGIAKSFNGIGSPDPTLVAIYAREKRTEQQKTNNYFLNELRKELANNKNNCQVAQQQISTTLQNLSEEIAQAKQDLQSVQQEIAEIANSKPQDWQERLNKLEGELQTLTTRLAESEEQTKDFIGILEQYGARISPIPPENPDEE